MLLSSFSTVCAVAVVIVDDEATITFQRPVRTMEGIQEEAIMATMVVVDGLAVTFSGASVALSGVVETAETLTTCATQSAMSIKEQQKW